MRGFLKGEFLGTSALIDHVSQTTFVHERFNCTISLEKHIPGICTQKKQNQTLSEHHRFYFPFPVPSMTTVFETIIKRKKAITLDTNSKGIKTDWQKKAMNNCDLYCLTYAPGSKTKRKIRPVSLSFFSLPFPTRVCHGPSSFSSRMVVATSSARRSRGHPGSSPGNTPAQLLVPVVQKPKFSPGNRLLYDAAYVCSKRRHHRRGRPGQGHVFAAARLRRCLLS